MSIRKLPQGSGSVPGGKFSGISESYEREMAALDEKYGLNKGSGLQPNTFKKSEQKEPMLNVFGKMTGYPTPVSTETATAALMYSYMGESGKMYYTRNKAVAKYYGGGATAHPAWLDDRGSIIRFMTADESAEFDW